MKTIPANPQAPQPVRTTPAPQLFWKRLFSKALALGIATCALANLQVHAIKDPFPPNPGNQVPGVDLPGYVSQRNVLLVVMDDVGIDLMPKYVEYYATNSVVGDEIDTGSTNTPLATPTFDRLVESGVTFLHAWSSPTCSPTRAGLFSGRSSFRHGVYSPSAPTLPAGTTTIAQVMGDAGYATGLFGKWHLGTVTADPLGRPHEFGWDQYAGNLGGMLTDYYNWSRTENGVTATSTTYATSQTKTDAETWITAQSGPWMATVTFNSAHWAQNAGGQYYQLPPAGTAYSVRAAIDDVQMVRSMIECADRKLDELLAAIDPVELEKTTIILMGDNGTDSDITSHFAADHSKASLYEGGVNVPLIIADGYTYLHGTQSSFLKGVGRVVSPGRFEDAPVQTMDLFATIAEIGDADATCGTDSVSLVPYLQSATTANQRAAIMAETLSNSGQWDLAVRGPSYKLIVRDYDGAAPTYELYAVTTDRWESTNLLADGASWFESIVQAALLGYLDDLVTLPDTCP
ncbi:MAG: sulfatase-like hydrolase/transferase [Verrucomicrobiales bacterium]|nr:sulfatase-like hydrolase/transferase [Verrucomicrobiales bacterium]